MFLTILMRTGLAFGGPLVAVITLYFVVGSRLRFIPQWVWIAVILGLFVIWLIVLFWKWYSARKKAKTIETVILRQAQASADSATPARREEIQEVRKNLEEAMATLKKGPQGKRALYAIPWYMIIGPPAIGKTTAIVNSGLNFPNMTTAKRMRGAGGTRNCDWWLSTDAILLDTAGRYVQSSDRSETEGEWFSFLEMLRRQRGKGPINGLILGYSLETLIEKNETQVVDDARELRQRMDEMLDHLRWSFPVYLLFTKCDLVSGFAEFFSNLSPLERQQVWGANFPIVQGSDQKAAENFTREYDAISARLRDVRTRRMVGLGRGEAWGKIFMFPEEFTALRAKLVLFIETLFEPNPFRKDAPLFRGAYFSSGKQEGKPFEIAVQKIQSLLGLGGKAGPAAQEQKEDAYFVRDVFARVLKADLDVSRRTHSAAGSLARLQLIVSAVALALGTLMSVWIFPFAWGRLASKMGSTEKRAEAVLADAGSGASIESLERLEGLHKEYASGWNAWPLTAADDVKHKAEEIYRKTVRGEVLEPIEEKIASQLGNAENGDLARRLLRAELHLVLTGQKETRDVGGEKDLPGTIAEQGWNDAEEQAKAAQLLENPVTDFLDAGKPLDRLDRGALRRGGERLVECQEPEPYYEAIVAAASREVEPVTVKSLVPKQKLLESDQSVRGAFTKAGWESSVSKSVNDVNRVIEEDNRLLKIVDVPPSERAPSKDQLQALYAKGYEAEWADFLESIRLPSHGSCEEAADDFKELQSPKGSPLLQLLEAAGKSAALGEKVVVASVGGQRGVEEAMEPLIAFSLGDDKNPAPSGEYADLLDGLYDQIDACSAGEKTETKVFRDADKWAKEYSDRYAGARSVSGAMQRLLAMPFSAAQKLIGGDLTATPGQKAAMREAAEAAADLSEKYPFARSGEPAKWDEILAVFGPDGALAKLEAEAKGDASPPAGVEECLADVREIRRSLDFSADALSAEFTMVFSSPDPQGAIGQESKKAIDRITVTVNGEEHGILAPFGADQSEPATWSTDVTEDASGIQLEQTHPKRRLLDKVVSDETTWSWFKVLDAAESGKDPSAFRFVFETADVSVELRIKMKGGGECPFSRNSSFRKFRVPEAWAKLE